MLNHIDDGTRLLSVCGQPDTHDDQTDTTPVEWSEGYENTVSVVIADTAITTTFDGMFTTASHAVFSYTYDRIDPDGLDDIVFTLNRHNGTRGCSVEVVGGVMLVAVPLPTRVVSPIKASDVLPEYHIR